MGECCTGLAGFGQGGSRDGRVDGNGACIVDPVASGGTEMRIFPYVSGLQVQCEVLREELVIASQDLSLIPIRFKLLSLRAAPARQSIAASRKTS